MSLNSTSVTSCSSLQLSESPSTHASLLLTEPSGSVSRSITISSPPTLASSVIYKPCTLTTMMLLTKGMIQSPSLPKTSPQLRNAMSHSKIGIGEFVEEERIGSTSTSAQSVSRGDILVINACERALQEVLDLRATQPCWV